MPTKSIFTTLLNRVLWTTLVPLGGLILIISLISCFSVKKNEEVRVEQEVVQYSLEAKKRIDTALSVVESIQSYPYISKNLQNQFKDSSDVFDFISQTNVYLNNITDTLDEVSIKIYYTNEMLYDSKYFVSSLQLDTYPKLLDKLQNKEKPFIWESGFRELGNGRKQIVFYKKFPLSSCDILECTITLPETKDEIDIFDNAQNKYDDSEHIVSGITESIKALGIINYRVLHLKYILIMFIALLFMVGIFVLIFYVTSRVLKKATHSITKFIEGLDVESLAELENISSLHRNSVSKELFTISKTISMLCDEVKRIENIKKDIEIELEQRKISYHTVYNALSSIRIKSYEIDEPQIIKIVDGLVEYYRMVLNKGNNMTFLSNEITMAEKYVLVSELSNYEPYQFIADIPQELKFFRIPHMIILPFVENSINHGLTGVRRKGVVKISAYQDGDYLVITVYDNGSGISKEQLEKLNDMENYSLGYGVKNVYARLNLMYGADSTIFFKSEEGKGTTVTIRFRAFGNE